MTNTSNPLSIPTPDEVAEANRIKDESARVEGEADDDKWLETWAASAVAVLSEYRGKPIEIDMGIARHSGKEYSRDIHSPARFAAKVRDRFGAAGWHCRDRVPGRPGDRSFSPGYISFEAAREEKAPAEPTFWRKIFAYLADEGP